MRWLRPTVLVPILCVGALDAQLIRVPADEPTIRAALLSATSGTTILVAPGIYRESLTWPSRDGIRLISEHGAAVTTIDAGQQDRVVYMWGPLTRATLLQGFTITNGMLQGGELQRGAGILIARGDPTIRSNRIVNNTCVAATTAMGAGIYVAALTIPRIELNTIEGNVARIAGSGSTQALGGGVFADSLSRPELYANHFLRNEARDGQTSKGGAIYLSSASCIVNSNHIMQNVARDSSILEGGGICVDNTLFAFIHNNTVVDNHCVGGLSMRGGGIYLGVGNTQLFNNIVAHNTEGIHANGGTVMLDYNDVWNNAIADYTGLAPGPNDISVDPDFVDAQMFHIARASPCLDAGLDSILPPMPNKDPDGDSRRSDGDLDGPAGNGARVDIGADEYDHVDLASTGSVVIGATVTLHTAGPAGWPYGIMLGFAAAPGGFAVGSWGNVLVGGEPLVVLGLGTVPGADPLTIPPWPSARGLILHAQSLVTSPADPSIGNFTNLWEGIIH